MGRVRAISAPLEQFSRFPLICVTNFLLDSYGFPRTCSCRVKHIESPAEAHAVSTILPLTSRSTHHSTNQDWHADDQHKRCSENH